MSFLAPWDCEEIARDADTEGRFVDALRIRQQWHPFRALLAARDAEAAGDTETAAKLRAWIRGGGTRSGLGLGHAVEDGIIRYLSVSALTMADSRSEGCPRKWWYRYVGGIKEAQTAAQALGTEMHANIARYLQTGERTFGQLAMTGLHVIPDPGPDLLIEHPLTPIRRDEDGGIPASLLAAPLRAAGIPLIGDVDLCHRRAINKGAENVDEVNDPPGTTELLDWKSTGDGKYAKTGSELAKTVQMIGYAEWAYRAIGDDDMRVRLSHGYFFTRVRKPARKMTILVDREQISREWGRVDGVARTLADVAKETTADRVPANLAACRAFGGCKHRTYCKAGMTSSLDAFLGRTAADSLINPQTNEGEEDMSILSMIGKPAAPAATTAPAATPEPKAPPTAEELRAAEIAKLPEGIVDAIDVVRNDTLGRPQMRGAATDALRVVLKLGATPGAALAGAGPLHVMVFEKAEQIVELAGILRDPDKRAELVAALAASAPEGSAPAEAVVPRVVVGTIAPIPAAAIRISPPDAAESHPALASNTPPAPGPAVPAGDISQVTEDKKPRTRTKRVDPAGTTGEVAPTSVTNVAAPAPQASGGGERSLASPGGIALFVNCVPSVSATDMSGMIDAWCAALAAKCPNADGSPLADLRFAGEGSQLGFGRWKGALAALVRETTVPPGAYYLDTRGDERAEVVATALKPRAALHVRGAL